MKSYKLISNINIAIALIGIIILYVYYTNKATISNWFETTGGNWIWLILLVLAAFLYKWFFFRKTE